MQQALWGTGGDSAVAVIHIIVEPTVRTNEEVLMGCDQALEPPSPYGPEYRGGKGVRPRVNVDNRRLRIELLQ